MREDLTEIEGYSSYGQNPKKGYSGVGVYTRHEPSEIPTKFHTRFDAEGRVLAMRFDAFTLFNIYFPNESEVKNE